MTDAMTDAMTHATDDATDDAATRYVEFRPPPGAPATDTPMLLGRVLSTVHGYNSEVFPTDGLDRPAAKAAEARRIAVAFVGYSDDPDAPTPGLAIRLFAREETLTDFLASRHGAFARTAMTPGAVRCVPQGHGHAVFFRDRRDERGTGGWLRRSEARFVRRAKARGLADGGIDGLVAQRRTAVARKQADQSQGDPSLGDTSQEGRNQAEDRDGRTAPRKTLPYLCVRSGSTTRSFSLFIGRRMVRQAESGGVNTYGLAGDGGRSVPSF